MVIVTTMPGKQTNDRGNKKLYWDLVLNNYTEKECDDVIELFEEIGKSFVIGKEVGESGTPHLQACIKLNKPNYSTYIYNMIKKKGIVNDEGNSRCSIRPGRNIEALAEYCRKGNDIIAEKNMDEFKLIKKMTMQDHLDRLYMDINEERDQGMYCTLREIYGPTWRTQWNGYIKWKAPYLKGNDEEFEEIWMSIGNAE